MELEDKINVLAEGAKYDVSCSSSGVSRGGSKGGIGNAAAGGICHSWAEDGRCISLLKTLLSNDCIYDCKYCRIRHSNDLRRSSFSVQELVDITLKFYRRNYIEGLFLSSAVLGSPDKTMTMMLDVIKTLRNDHGFGGYIHLKAIPGSSEALLSEAGLYADRMSVNMELPSESSLKLLAPQKKRPAILKPMAFLGGWKSQYEKDRGRVPSVPRFLPAGQTTQMIIGASPESDRQILGLMDALYKKFDLKRVYYSAYVAVNQDPLLPSPLEGGGLGPIPLSSPETPLIGNGGLPPGEPQNVITSPYGVPQPLTSPGPPLLREHRLYQADWLVRFYRFNADEILDLETPFLDRDLDPKAAWAARNPDFFPMEINTASYEELLRVPGIGVNGAQRIIRGRRTGRIGFDHLKRMGIVLKRARHFILCGGQSLNRIEVGGPWLRERLLGEAGLGGPRQLELF